MRALVSNAPLLAQSYEITSGRILMELLEMRGLVRDLHAHATGAGNPIEAAMSATIQERIKPILDELIRLGEIGNFRLSEEGKREVATVAFASTDKGAA